MATPGDTLNGLRDLLRHAPRGSLIADRLRDAVNTITVLMTRLQVLDVEAATLRENYDAMLMGERMADREIHRLLDVIAEAVDALSEDGAPMDAAIAKASTILARGKVGGPVRAVRDGQ